MAPEPSSPTAISQLRETSFARETSPLDAAERLLAGKIEDYTIYPLSELPPHEISISMGDVYRRCRNPEEVVVSVVISEFSAYVMNALKESTDKLQFNSLKYSKGIT
ncbi:hypothetical protein C8J56DRAFT_896469 [Mycena floridula]|nr:hypothetical protein C8J56DRAFT_896469 [Mycena floridula]